MRTSSWKRASGAIVGGGGLGQEFEGDGLAEGEVGGAIDFAHAAASQQSDDAVAVGEQGAGQEAAFIDGAGGGEARGGGGSEGDGRGGGGVERRGAGGAIPAGLRAFVGTGRASDHKGQSYRGGARLAGEGRWVGILVWSGDFGDGEAGWVSGARNAQSLKI